MGGTAGKDLKTKFGYSSWPDVVVKLRTKSFLEYRWFYIITFEAPFDC